MECRKIQSQSRSGNANAYKHGGRYTRLYRIWQNMRTRCNNPNATHYSIYGGRGIAVCDEWDDFVSFREWALSHGYCDTLTLDRINNDCGYSPQNCRWVSEKTQANNKRNNHNLSRSGIDGNITCVSEQFGVSRNVIKRRERDGITGAGLVARVFDPYKGDLQRNNTSGVTGVRQIAKTGHWIAVITNNGVRKTKVFRTREEAISQRKKWELEYLANKEVIDGGSIRH